MSRTFLLKELKTQRRSNHPNSVTLLPRLSNLIIIRSRRKYFIFQTASWLFKILRKRNLAANKSALGLSFQRGKNTSYTDEIDSPGIDGASSIAGIKTFALRIHKDWNQENNGRRHSRHKGPNLTFPEKLVVGTSSVFSILKRKVGVGGGCLDQGRGRLSISPP